MNIFIFINTWIVILLKSNIPWVVEQYSPSNRTWKVRYLYFLYYSYTTNTKFHKNNVHQAVTCHKGCSRFQTFVFIRTLMLHICLNDITLRTGKYKDTIFAYVGTVIRMVANYQRIIKSLSDSEVSNNYWRYFEYNAAIFLTNCCWYIGTAVLHSTHNRFLTNIVLHSNPKPTSITKLYFLQEYLYRVECRIQAGLGRYTWQSLNITEYCGNCDLVWTRKFLFQ